MDFNNQEVYKIAVVGPESTGKSTMAKYLAEQFDTVCVPEYSRYYCEHLNNQYTLQDEVNMYYGQVALEEALTPIAKNNILICDTTILTVKIWSDHLFGHTPEEVTNAIKSRKYDLYLLMDIDLPWVDDPLRDFPNEREYFMGIWEKELKAVNAQYKIVSGLDEKRLKNGINAAREIIKKR